MPIRDRLTRLPYHLWCQTNFLLFPSRMTLLNRSSKIKSKHLLSAKIQKHFCGSYLCSNLLRASNTPPESCTFARAVLYIVNKYALKKELRTPISYLLLVEVVQIIVSAFGVSITSNQRVHSIFDALRNKNVIFLLTSHYVVHP